MPCRFAGPASRRKFTRFRKQGFAAFIAGAIPYAAAPHAIAEGRAAPMVVVVPAAASSACLFKVPHGKGMGGKA
jgi:hypothetical protein